ncbi:MAG: hydroxysqualene dehydroxylase HpnE [Candidatus Omnitrophica bacterium]|nr:hydroxysqualene dehydroxylase HpnE [Candidatus Omnitrophota bacterium]
MSRPHVIVIGGGFAGLSAAVSLVDAGVRVTVLEARVGLGGRARSFTDPATGELVDNGQHLLIGGYHETRRFLLRLGTVQHLRFQRRLQVRFVEKGGRSFTLDCPPLPVPWHLVAGLARLGSLSLRDKAGLRAMLREGTRLLKGGVSSERELDEETVEGWLIRLGQSARIRSAFWYPLTVAALNEDPRRASALGLWAVLKRMVFSQAQDACLGVPTVGLTDLYAASAARLVQEAGGEIRLNTSVTEVVLDGAEARGIRTAGGDLLFADAVISSLPPGTLKKILPASCRESDPFFCRLDRFKTSPIVSMNLWLDRPITPDWFVGFVGTRIQWLFNKPAILGNGKSSISYASLLISAAHEWVGCSNEALLQVALEDLWSCFPHVRGVRPVKFQVVREREATVSLTPGMERFRLSARTPLEGFFCAGDWTDTGLPATIESAVISGRQAAQQALKWLASSACGGKIPKLSYGSSVLPEKQATSDQ